MSKISIPNDQGDVLVGILEKKPKGDIGSTRPRVVLITHGVLGHKDYLFHRVLAEALPYTSFRFDFRGNGESTGTPGYAHMEEDTEDIFTVAAYFEKLGYQIYGIVGHSRGSIAGLKYATSCENHLKFFVNVSGRFKMNDNQIYRNRPEIGQGLKEKGYFDWRVKQRDRIVTIKVTQREVDRFIHWSNEHVSRMPMSTSVLTCHGLNDTIVPPYNAAMFANKIPNHTLSLIPEADHNFKGHFQQVTDAIIQFLETLDEYQRAKLMGQHVGLVIPRWIDIDGVRNFRDIGGWPIKDGTGYIRERIVFRSGHLSNLTSQGASQLSKLNINATFDFRLGQEIKRDGIMQTIPGVTRFGYNLYENVIKTPEDLYKNLSVFLEGEEGFAKGYMIILESGKKLIGDVFKYMIHQLSVQDRKAILIHCTAGKDRTGVFIMTLLGLCGVDEEIIAKEYELSNIGYFDYEKDLVERSRKVGVSVDQMRAALSASYGGMKLTISQLKEKYGSFEGYVRDGCGLTTEEINLIREIMVVPVPFEERQLYRPKI